MPRHLALTTLALLAAAAPSLLAALALVGLGAASSQVRVTGVLPPDPGVA